MVDDRDKQETEVVPSGTTKEGNESVSAEEEELFTSAEYDFRLLSQSLIAAMPESTEVVETSDESKSESTDPVAEPAEASPPWAEDDTSAPPAILPPIEKPKGSFERPSGSLEDLVEEEITTQARRKEPLQEMGDPARNLPGKDTQSVVVDMGQLNEDTERKAMAIAAQRAAFSPLESSGAMERITFSNLAAMNFAEQEDESSDSDSEDGSTVNLHRDQLSAPAHTPQQNEADASDLDNQTFDATDPIEHSVRRPGRWLLLILVALVCVVLMAAGWAVWNLGEHRSLLMRKPVQAIEMGLGLRAFPLPPAPKAAVLKMQKIAGSLEIENIQVDWAKDKRSATVSGRIKNASNVTHDRVELSIQLFDEMTNSITIQRSKCCQVIEPVTKTPTPDKAMPKPQGTQTAGRSRLEPGKEERFSTQIKIRKPTKGEVTAKVTVYYSEVVD